LPSALVVVDVMKEYIAVAEANRLGIPVFAMVDTNSDPTNIDFVIPANDDATKSIEIIFEALCAAITEGLEERKVEKIDTGAAESNDDAAPVRRERRARTGRRTVVAKDNEAASEAASKKEEE
jgi:small subunit ribosomal protein S2